MFENPPTMANMPQPIQQVLAPVPIQDQGNPFLKPGILTGVLTLGIVLILGLGTSQEVSQNWPKYRCRPDIMPFAGLYGYNAQENIEFCLKNVFLKINHHYLCCYYIDLDFSCEMNQHKDYALTNSF